MPKGGRRIFPNVGEWVTQRDCPADYVFQKNVFLQSRFGMVILSVSCEIIPRWMTQNPHRLLVNSGSCNGLLPSGNKPLS